MITEPYRLIGSNGSPYSRKLRAILRYRRLPYIWVLRTERNQASFADLRPPLIPVLETPDGGQRLVDTTPIAYMLEKRHPGHRSVMPEDPARAFLSHLIEDMADEWLTKAMFHYRWAYDADIHYASHWIADDFFPDRSGEARNAAARDFAQRQIERMPLVGCTPENASIIEASYYRIIECLETHVGAYWFLFGTRPALADFGLYGQLQTLATDPTSQTIMRTSAQRTESWVRQMDDGSGIEGEWYAPDAPLPDATAQLIRFCGEVYLPFLAANAHAAENGAQDFGLELLGRPYRQATFGYQVKCLAELRRQVAALDANAGERVRDALTGTPGWGVLDAGECVVKQ